MSGAPQIGCRSLPRLRWLLALGALLQLSTTACQRASSEANESKAQQLTVDDGSTGVSLCDSYLDQYENCIIPGLPPAQVQRHRAGIVRQRESFRSLATTPAKQESLRRICASAIVTARQEFPSCAFSGT